MWPDQSESSTISSVADVLRSGSALLGLLLPLRIVQGETDWSLVLVFGGMWALLFLHLSEVDWLDTVCDNSDVFLPTNTCCCQQ